MLKKLVFACAVTGLGLAFAGCERTAPKPQNSQPSFYRSLASASAAIDAETARDMISAYRRNHGLPPLALDSSLGAAAQAEARDMARADTPASAEAIKQRLASAGMGRGEVNTSAGYHTFAEAFSGWRDSPQHNRVMLTRDAKRMGIATAYAPGSKYKVYWVLIEAP